MAAASRGCQERMAPLARAMCMTRMRRSALPGPFQGELKRQPLRVDGFTEARASRLVVGGGQLAIQAGDRFEPLDLLWRAARVLEKRVGRAKIGGECEVRFEIDRPALVRQIVEPSFLHRLADLVI